MVYGCKRERVSIDGEYSGKIIDTDLRVVETTCIQWRSPGLRSRVAVTLSPSLGADLLDCQSQYIGEKKKRERRNETITQCTQSHNPVVPQPIGKARWQSFGGFGVRGNSTSIGRW